MTSALDAQGIAPACSKIPANKDTLLYTFTPLRLRLALPQKDWVNCEPNTLILMPNHSTYWIDTSIIKTDSHHCWFSFSDLYDDPLIQVVQNETGIARFLDPKGTIGLQMRAVAATVQHNRADAFWPLQYMGHSILNILRKARRMPPGLYEIDHESKTVDSPLIARVTGYFLRHLEEPIDLDTIAKAIHVSKSTLSHVYRKETGESPLHTLRRLRLHKVKTLLMQNLSLSAIAQMTGFYDAHHVSREFKRAEGVSPSVFLARIDASRHPPQAKSARAVAS